MIVDDRLETVLRTAAAGTGARRTQLRQLVDLLARTSDTQWTPLHGAAMERIDSLRAALGDAASAALIGTCTLRSPRLVRHFGAASPKVALSAIVAARLHEEEWLDLIPDLPVQARGFLRHRRDLGPAVEALLARFGITDFALPLPAGFEPLVMAAPAPPELPAEESAAQPAHLAPAAANPMPAPQAEGIGAIIQRIEAFRRARSADQGGGSLPEAIEAAGQSRLPFADEPLTAARPVTALDLRLDSDGTVIAADAAHASALVGLRPFSADADAPAACDAASSRAARARRPIIAGLLSLESSAPVAGAWQIDAVPLFAPESGHFLGYQARLRRPSADAAQAGPVPVVSAAAANDDEASRNADRLRQLLHELRTPINAIQGYSELIQQQVMGPTPHQYRSLAAGIASDAARMLAGFEDIERLIGLEAGLATGQSSSAETGVGENQAELASMLSRLVSQLEPVLAPCEAALQCDMPQGPILVAIPPAELERSLWRLLSLMAGAMAQGDRIALQVTLPLGGTTAQLTLPLPAALAMREDTALAAGGGTAILGTGFALRLVAAEIRCAGGQFAREDTGQDRAELQIVLPLLTAARQRLSQSTSLAGQAG
jgi:signal transduction histidine kinase